MLFLTMARATQLAGCFVGVAVGVAIMGLAGCKQGQPLPELTGGAEMALRRGAAWSTIKVRPPYAIGPRVNLHFNHGEVSGQIDPGEGFESRSEMLQTRPGPVNRYGAVHLTINDEGIQGSGPYGAVAVDVEEGPSELTFDGTWNGARVHFTVTADELKGSIPIRRFGRSDSVGNVSTCQYTLDHVTPDGAREGSSICNGLPEQTRLEIPRQVEAWLTRKEMVVVLLALLSTPPHTVMEQQNTENGLRPF
jgi:hypothetical protein